MAEIPGPELVEGVDRPHGVPLELRRIRNEHKPPVLLLHGASAQHETFRIPEGRSLAEFLWQNGYEPWLLDWRGSRRVTDSMGADRLKEMRLVLDLDHAAREDVPWALRTIIDARDAEDSGDKHKIHVIAHCLGAAVLAQAIAADDLSLPNGISLSNRLGRIVLLTIGLFYEAPLDGKMKGQFNVLERLWIEGDVHIIDPRHPNGPLWPDALRDIYRGVGPGLLPHPRADAAPHCSHALCNRVSFMYGTPFRHRNLVDEIHGVWHVKFRQGKAEPRVGERLHVALHDARDESSAAAGGEPPIHGPIGRPVANPGVGFVLGVERTSGSWHRGTAQGMLTLSGCTGEFPSIVLSDGRAPQVYYELRALDERIAICDGREMSGRELHGSPEEDGEGDELDPRLESQFGGVPLRMYLQGALNVRRRWAEKWDSDPESDKPLIKESRGNFHKLPAVTLITGEHNQLWHRDSVNRMHEWITAGLSRKDRARFTKAIIADYGHQDLLWGKEAWDDVFPRILNQGLGGAGSALLADDDPQDPDSGPIPRA